MVGGLGEAKATPIHFSASGYLDKMLFLCLLDFAIFLQGSLKPKSPLPSQTFSACKCTRDPWYITVKQQITKASVTSPTSVFKRKSLHLLRHLNQPDIFVRILFLVKFGLGAFLELCWLILCVLLLAWYYHFNGTCWKLFQNGLGRIIKVLKTQHFFFFDLRILFKFFFIYFY